MFDAVSKVEHAPPDAIFGVQQRCNASPLQDKHLLSVGVYRTAEGKPYVFPCVRKADERILNKFDKEYLPMTGDQVFIDAARRLLFTQPILDQYGDRIASVQSCAGTGALFLTSRFAEIFLRPERVYLSDPMWPNYQLIFGGSKHNIVLYPYINKQTGFIDIPAILSTIRDGPDNCLMVLQVCAHNPTGVDPTLDEFRQIFEVCKEKNCLICFDFAYMGFASGDMDVDATPVREYIKLGIPFIVCFSFSKCMGLYGERVGCFHMFCNNKTEAENIRSQVARIGRMTWSVCPKNGSYIAAEIMNDPNLTKEWAEELKSCGDRLIQIRNKFCDLLEAKTGKSWQFIRNQKGMFAYTGLNKQQVDLLAEEGVFIPNSGRVSIPALNDTNVEAIAQAFVNVLKKSESK